VADPSLAALARTPWPTDQLTNPETLFVLSRAERRQFDALVGVLATDPYMVAASRSARRRVRRHRVWAWLAPLVVARKQARYRARLLADGRA
jgi:hypothetical protein